MLAKDKRSSSITGAAHRDRRTVPLTASSHRQATRIDADDGADHSTSYEDDSILSTAQSASANSGISGTKAASATSSMCSLESRSTRKPISRTSNDRSRRKSKSLPTTRVSTAELKRSIYERQKQDKKEPQAKSEYSQNQLELSNLLSLDDSLDESFVSNSKKNRPKSLTRLGVRSSFDVDEPRDSSRLPKRSVSLGSQSAISAQPDPNYSEEQDAWAGIDQLLEGKSLDDSFTFSTTDILPKAVVQAMRREAKYDDETVWGDDVSEAELTHMSVPVRSQAKPKSGNHESWKDERERLRGDAGLFDMFQWSHKDNIDDQRMRKGKLNNNARKLQLLGIKPAPTPPEDTDNSSLPSLATFRADDFSVMSSATSVDWSTQHSKNMALGNDTNHSKSVASVGNISKASVGKSNNVEFASFDGNFLEHKGTSEDNNSVSNSFAESTGSTNSQSLAGDGLVLDKRVDDYIRMIQKKLPTISENENSPSKRGRNKQVDFFGSEKETSPSPTSVIMEQSVMDELPSLADFKSPRKNATDVVVDRKQVDKKGRKEEKSEPKPSLTFLMNSFKKKVATKVKPQKKLGNDAKYFPDAVRPGGGNAKKFSANRCLLNQDEDGVNWDAD